MPSNFGGNQRWSARVYQPASEDEVLEILQRHGHGHIRPLGAGHSWSAIAVCSDVMLDMSRFDEVRLETVSGQPVVRAGAGCSLQGLLDKLHATSDRTLPTLGAIKRQTIAGAISTGTHGSGRPSLSHFVVGLRLAAYDPADGRARVVDLREEKDLEAARCALGCMGVILSVVLATVPKYNVAESVTVEPTLERVLERFGKDSLTQFALVPYAWEFLVFERTPYAATALPLRQRLAALFWRLVNTLWVDVGFHLGVKACLALGSRAVRRWMQLTPLLAPRYRRIDAAEHVLTLGHYYFRHEEMELFVPQSDLAEALEILRYATGVFAGDEVPAPRAAARLPAGLRAQLVRSGGLYTHHYPLSVRRLEQEDNMLISMGCPAGGAKRGPLYAISVFTYQAPDERQGYYAFCAWLARAMYDLYRARPHWGKHFPLDAGETARLYPRLEEFRQLCRGVDPRGVFVNHYTAEVLGLAVAR